MYIEYRSYFLFNRFLPNSCILTRENVRFRFQKTIVNKRTIELNFL